MTLMGMLGFVPGLRQIKESIESCNESKDQEVVVYKGVVATIKEKTNYVILVDVKGKTLPVLRTGILKKQSNCELKIEVPSNKTDREMIKQFISENYRPKYSLNYC